MSILYWIIFFLKSTFSKYWGSKFYQTASLAVKCSVFYANISSGMYYSEQKTLWKNILYYIYNFMIFILLFISSHGNFTLRIKMQELYRKCYNEKNRFSLRNLLKVYRSLYIIFNDCNCIYAIRKHFSKCKKNMKPYFTRRISKNFLLIFLLITE